VEDTKILESKQKTIAELEDNIKEERILNRKTSKRSNITLVK